jgi:AraC family transcriptional regulator
MRIENCIAEPLDIQSLAAVVHLSPYYFQRLFTRLVGWPVAEYQKQRRLARALIELMETDKRILDIALDFGFKNHDTFTRAFKAAFGLTPAQARKLGRKPSDYTYVYMPDITMRYQLIDENVPLISDGVLLEISRRKYVHERIYAGVQGDFPQSVPNNLNPGIMWGYLYGKKISDVPFLHCRGEHVGITTTTENDYRYFAGYHVTERCPGYTEHNEWTGNENAYEYINPRNQYISLPPGDYLVCTFTAEDFSRLVDEALSRVLRYLFGTFVENHKLEVCGPLIDVYDERSLRWHPGNLIEQYAPYLEPREPKLSGWEGPEMELQIMLKG